MAELFDDQEMLLLKKSRLDECAKEISIKHEDLIKKINHNMKELLKLVYNHPAVNLAHLI